MYTVLSFSVTSAYLIGESRLLSAMRYTVTFSLVHLINTLAYWLISC